MTTSSLKKNTLLCVLYAGIVFSVGFFVYTTAFAIDVHMPGESITIGEFIYNDDYSPTTDDCTISIYSPAGATLVNEATMTDDSTGWHYYPYTTPVTEGSYPAFITCGATLTGDLMKLDKSFVVKVSSLDTDAIASAVWASPSRSLTSFGSLVSDIWSNSSRTLSAFGSLAADIWDNSFAVNRQLTTKDIAGGGSLATESYIDASQATIVGEIETNRTLINALNNISAADVWAYGTRSTNAGSVSIDSNSIAAVWQSAASGLNTTGSIGKLIVDNLDAQVSSRGTSTLTAGDVWASTTRTLSTTGVDALSSGVWSAASRTLSNYGNDITAADVWNTLSSSLTTVGSIGEQLANNVDIKNSDILTEVQANATLINALNNISAADVWAYGTRSVTTDVTISNASLQALWNTATVDLATTGSVGKLIVDNLNAQVSSRGTSNLTAADVWASATRTLTDYSDSTIAAAVWANATRTLSNYGNDITAADVWNTLSSSLTTVGSIGEQLVTNIDATISSRASMSVGDSWSVKMGNVDRVQTGQVYRTKVFVLNNSAPSAPYATPTVTLYDPQRNISVSAVSMSLISTGVYEYTYTVSPSAAQGLWETIASTEVESGKTVQTNDYWEVAGSPAQVLINSVSATDPSTILGNVTVTNEGLTGYEYDYEWCVVSDQSNVCGGNDDLFYASAAKFINPGETWNTTLSAAVTSAGTYYFKLVVHFGTDNSSASRVFTVIGSTPPGGGGGGGGTPPPNQDTCNGADFNKNSVVDSTDFSIMLYFWKTAFPFKNPCVDINGDKNVNSIDFSIMLFQWGKRPLST